jgi:hypothetical protein
MAEAVKYPKALINNAADNIGFVTPLRCEHYLSQISRIQRNSPEDHITENNRGIIHGKGLRL